jgi:hypothetical protein
MFVFYFGLDISKALGGPKGSSSLDPDKTWDILVLIGTTILWVFWPSFVGVMETRDFGL